MSDVARGWCSYCDIIVHNAEMQGVTHNACGHPVRCWPVTKEQAPTKVYVCSNRECDAVWDTDPQGHCPKCRKPNGGGWSTMRRDVQPLPEPPK